jgi:hypothetical protein
MKTCHSRLFVTFQNDKFATDIYELYIQLFLWQ